MMAIASLVTTARTAEEPDVERRISHWIAGDAREGSGDRTADVCDPATGRVTGCVDLADGALVEEALSSAAAAWLAWRRVPLNKRIEVLLSFRQLLSDRRHDLAEIITAEHGKVLDDALGEVSRGLEVVEFACGISPLLKGGYSEGVSTDIDVHSIRQPVGVSVIISPFNFPAMVPMWFFPVAIACGNVVILKPSEKNPSAALWLAELWAEAGLPDGVFSVVQGDKEAVDSLISDDRVAAVSFVGSTPVARQIYRAAGEHGKRVQALGGAKNHMVVLPDADLDFAADAAINAGFGSAGERCMAISVVVAVDPIGDGLIERIRERMVGLRTGDGRRGCDMGPLITAVHRDRVASYIQSGVDQGARLVVDGRELSDIDGEPGGFWLKPTLFDAVTPEMTIYTDEVFGPVLSVVRVPTYSAAIELVNSCVYGNGTALFTSNGEAADRFMAEVEVGMVGINVPIPVPVGFYSFGGWKHSFFGDLHAYGEDGVRFFTRGKVVTSRWRTSGPSVIDLGFPGATDS